MVDPGALHLAIAAFFAPLENQAFISTVEISGNNQIVIGFSARAPQGLGEKMAQELSEIPVTLIHSGLTLDLSSLTSRAQIRSVGLRVGEILTAAGSTIASPGTERNRNEVQSNNQMLPTNCGMSWDPPGTPGGSPKITPP